MALLTTFFWGNASYSGSAQLNVGPYHVGFVNKFFRVEVHGQINTQAQPLGDTSVLANRLVFGVQQVPHTASAEDVITSSDSDTWFVRRQVGDSDMVVGWAPSTDVASVLPTNAVHDDWAGQLAIGADTDVWFSFRNSDLTVQPNYNTYGTMRIWWG